MINANAFRANNPLAQAQAPLPADPNARPRAAAAAAAPARKVFVASGSELKVERGLSRHDELRQDDKILLADMQMIDKIPKERTGKQALIQYVDTSLNAMHIDQRTALLSTYTNTKNKDFTQNTSAKLFRNAFSVQELRSLFKTIWKKMDDAAKIRVRDNEAEMKGNQSKSKQDNSKNAEESMKEELTSILEVTQGLTKLAIDDNVVTLYAIISFLVEANGQVPTHREHYRLPVNLLDVMIERTDVYSSKALIQFWQPESFWMPCATAAERSTMLRRTTALIDIFRHTELKMENVNVTLHLDTIEPEANTQDLVKECKILSDDQESNLAIPWLRWKTTLSKKVKVQIKDAIYFPGRKKARFDQVGGMCDRISEWKEKAKTFDVEEEQNRFFAYRDKYQIEMPITVGNVFYRNAIKQTINEELAQTIEETYQDVPQDTVLNDQEKLACLKQVRKILRDYDTYQAMDDQKKQHSAHTKLKADISSLMNKYPDNIFMTAMHELTAFQLRYVIYDCTQAPNAQLKLCAQPPAPPVAANMPVLVAPDLAAAPLAPAIQAQSQAQAAPFAANASPPASSNMSLAMRFRNLGSPSLSSPSRMSPAHLSPPAHMSPPASMSPSGSGSQSGSRRSRSSSSSPLYSSRRTASKRAASARSRSRSRSRSSRLSSPSLSSISEDVKHSAGSSGGSSELVLSQATTTKKAVEFYEKEIAIINTLTVNKMLGNEFKAVHSESKRQLSELTTLIKLAKSTSGSSVTDKMIEAEQNAKAIVNTDLIYSMMNFATKWKTLNSEKTEYARGLVDFIGQMETSNVQDAYNNLKTKLAQTERSIANLIDDNKDISKRTLRFVPLFSNAYTLTEANQFYQTTMDTIQATLERVNDAKDSATNDGMKKTCVQVIQLGRTLLSQLQTLLNTDDYVQEENSDPSMGSKLAQFDELATMLFSLHRMSMLDSDGEGAEAKSIAKRITHLKAILNKEIKSLPQAAPSSSMDRDRDDDFDGFGDVGGDVGASDGPGFSLVEPSSSLVASSPLARASVSGNGSPSQRQATPPVARLQSPSLRRSPSMQDRDAAVTIARQSPPVARIQSPSARRSPALRQIDAVVAPPAPASVVSRNSPNNLGLQSPSMRRLTPVQQIDASANAGARVLVANNNPPSIADSILASLINDQDEPAQALSRGSDQKLVSPAVQDIRQPERPSRGRGRGQRRGRGRSSSSSRARAQDAGEDGIAPSVAQQLVPPVVRQIARPNPAAAPVPAVIPPPVPARGRSRSGSKADATQPSATSSRSRSTSRGRGRGRARGRQVTPVRSSSRRNKGTSTRFSKDMYDSNVPQPRKR